MSEKKFKPSPELDRLVLPPNEREPQPPSEDIRLKGYGEKPVNLFRTPWLRNSNEEED